MNKAVNEHIEIKSIKNEKWTDYFEDSYNQNKTTPNIVLDKAVNPIIITEEEVEAAIKKQESKDTKPRQDT